MKVFNYKISGNAIEILIQANKILKDREKWFEQFKLDFFNITEHYKSVTFKALCDKIEYMMGDYKGDPLSVLPMLKAIAADKKKNFAGKDTNQGYSYDGPKYEDEGYSIYRKGIESYYGETTILEGIKRSKKGPKPRNDYEVYVAKKLPVGHFRWNYQLYTLSKIELDHLRNFLNIYFVELSNVKKLKIKRKLNNVCGMDSIGIWCDGCNVVEGCKIYKNSLTYKDK